jgi:hypothetical protein
MRNHNEIPSSITPPIDFGNTDLLKIMTDLCYEPVRSASPLELLSTEAVPSNCPCKSVASSTSSGGKPYRSEGLIGLKYKNMLVNLSFFSCSIMLVRRPLSQPQPLPHECTSTASVECKT